MKKIVQVNIKGIKCDVCDFIDMSVEYEDYPQWLNKPCPKCGANLLTQADLDTVKTLIETTNLVNTFFEDLEVKVKDDNEFTKIKLDMNGSGKIFINLDSEEIKKIEEN